MSARKEQDHEYSQPTLNGLVAPEQNETLLYNCLVLSRAHYKATGKKQQWTCSFHAQPSIFLPDIDAVFLASATHEQAVEARKQSLKPGDRVRLTGIISAEII